MPSSGPSHCCALCLNTLPYAYAWLTSLIIQDPPSASLPEQALTARSLPQSLQLPGAADLSVILMVALSALSVNLLPPHHSGLQCVSLAPQPGGGR